MIDASVVNGLDWFWIGIAATVPLLGGLLLAWPIWLWKQPILGNIAGSIVAFGFGMAMIMRERTALDLAVSACIEAGETCWPDPSAFTRFAIYAFISLAQVIAIFTISVSVESRERRKHYAPEWR